ncbi:hypothetical protein Poli38472_007670 [Pythium oligandrum]|uniref:Uncharacterized protein n=1 Tax=Pythium oligandrum TaxID=41045 RepID=A0A8K1CS82_PYTOL|nr:hypothetical protein Poli38472_007670 [Pythium oligandrum]|eukprot:TMW67998.1 hypothetical protein Poli38472_007670 [Pythium oligandrum]
MMHPNTVGGGNDSSFTSLSSLPATRTNQYGGSNESWWQRVKRWDAVTLMRYLRYVNVVLALLQAFAGFMGLFDLVALDITNFLISVYAIIFALLLLAFECRFQSMEPKIRQQFGFLFTYRGRTAFIFCVGFMDFGMDGSLAWTVGALMCANALFNLCIMVFHPEFRNGHLTASMDPTATYNGAGDETTQLLNEHPEYAAQATAFVAGQMKQNPQYAVQFAQAYTAPAPGSYVPPAPKYAGK